MHSHVGVFEDAGALGGFPHTSVTSIAEYGRIDGSTQHQQRNIMDARATGGPRSSRGVDI